MILPNRCDKDGPPCGNARTGPFSPDQCPRCWRTLPQQKLPDDAPPPYHKPTECKHTGRVMPPPPGLDVRKRYFQCDAGKGVVCRCNCGPKCDRYEIDPEVIEPIPAKPAPVPGKLHLAMHIYPSVGNNSWRRCLDQVMVRKSQFTGRKVIATVTGDGLHPWEDVRDYVGDFGEVVHVPNQRHLREVSTWEPLWDRVLEVADDRDRAFYCHAMGATHEINPGTTKHAWTSLLFSLLLDYWPEVENSLRHHPITGCFKKTGYGFDKQYGRWHYSGGFFVCRIDDFRRKRYGMKPPQYWAGTECWPGLAYDAGEAGCLFRETPVSKTNLYLMNVWRDQIIPEVRQWISSRSRTGTGSSRPANPPSDPSIRTMFPIQTTPSGKPATTMTASPESVPSAT